MPRKKRIFEKRSTEDTRYKDKTIGLLINKMIWSGKKGAAERIVYGAFDLLKEKQGKDPVEIFKQAVENVKPLMEVRSRRVGGANYQVPAEVRPSRRLSLALRWLIEGARERKEKDMSQRLAAEILETLENRGTAVRKKEEVHKMAEANKAFAHYKW